MVFLFWVCLNLDTNKFYTSCLGGVFWEGNFKSFPILSKLCLLFGLRSPKQVLMGQIISHPSIPQWLAQQAHHIPDSGSKGQRGKCKKQNEHRLPESNLGLSCVHPKVCTCFRNYWGKTIKECARWEAKDLQYFEKDSDEGWKSWSQDGAGYHLVQQQWPRLPPGSMTQFTSWMCAMLWHWVWRLVEDSAYIISHFLLKGLTKISMGLWEFKLLVLGNQVRVWIWLEPMVYKWYYQIRKRHIIENSFIYHLSILSSVHLSICPSSIYPPKPFLFSLLFLILLIQQVHSFHVFGNNGY